MTSATLEWEVSDGEILRGVVGSTAHGLGRPGLEDRDEMGVFVETPRRALGLTPLPHWTYRTQPEGVRSGPGDLDLTMYSLRRYAELAIAGNPTILLLLWLPEYTTCTPIGERLVASRDLFVSAEAGERFLGYLRRQRLRMTGERARAVNRPELVEAHGYDVKYAMHALRIGLQGIEYVRDRSIALPVPEPWLSTLRAIRAGEVPESDALMMILDVEARLRDAIDACDAVADREGIDRLLVGIHRDHWGLSRALDEG